jgi:hypothetical protein
MTIFLGIALIVLAVYLGLPLLADWLIRKVEQ